MRHTERNTTFWFKKTPNKHRKGAWHHLRGRIGEAKNPGPKPQGYHLVDMPMDGSCLYHGIGYHVGMHQMQVRAALTGLGKEPWHEICDWTRDSEQQAQEWEIFRQTNDEEQTLGGMPFNSQ